jgi:hypothetical protein
VRLVSLLEQPLSHRRGLGLPVGARQRLGQAPRQRGDLAAQNALPPFVRRPLLEQDGGFGSAPVGNRPL